MRQQLIEAILHFVRETGRDAKMIVMNPINTDELMKEMLDNNSYDYNNLTFMGIKVYRSMDMTYNKFEVG